MSMHNRLALSLIMLVQLAAVRAFAADGHFTVPDKDLASAEFGETRVVFMPNGAAVVMRGQAALMDLGLSFTAEGGYGLQLRDVHTGAPWKVGKQGREITTEGTLLAFRKKPSYLKYEETVALVPGGIHFRYKLTALRNLEFGHLGVSFHLPASKTRGASVRFSPSLPPGMKGAYAGLPETTPERPSGRATEPQGGNAESVPDHGATAALAAVLPLSRKEASLGSFAARSATLVKDEQPLVSWATQAPSQWQLYDERGHLLNTYRLALSTDPPVSALETGAATKLELAIYFHDTKDKDEPGAAAPQPLSSVGAEPPAVHPSPAVIPLADDLTTRGDWVGKYGTFAYVLPGMVGYSAIQGGPGWPLEFNVGTANPRIRPAAWVSPFDCSRDARALFNPTRTSYTAGSFDDHGEDYGAGKGPDLLVKVGVPAGLYRLSLYFFEIDWAQYRALSLEIRSGNDLVWTGPVEDFFNGVYKRFLVTGPQDLEIRINKLDSVNAVVNGIFLDRCVPPVPYPLAPSTAITIATDFPLGQADARLGELTGNPPPSRADSVRDLSRIYAVICQTGQGQPASFRDSCLPLLPKLAATVNRLLPGTDWPHDRSQLLWVLANCERASSHFQEAYSAVERLTEALKATDAQTHDTPATPGASRFADALSAAGDFDFAGLVMRQYLRQRLLSAKGAGQDEEKKAVLRSALDYADHMTSGKAYDRANELYSLAFETGIRPPDAAAKHWVFAQSLEHAYDYGRALQEYGHVADVIDSSHAGDALYTSRFLLTRLGRFQDAGAALARLSLEHPDFRPIQVKLAQAQTCYFAENLDGAEAALVQAAALASASKDHSAEAAIKSLRQNIEALRAQRQRERAGD